MSRAAKRKATANRVKNAEIKQEKLAEEKDKGRNLKSVVEKSVKTPSAEVKKKLMKQAKALGLKIRDPKEEDELKMK